MIEPDAREAWVNRVLYGVEVGNSLRDDLEAGLARYLADGRVLRPPAVVPMPEALRRMTQTIFDQGRPTRPMPPEVRAPQSNRKARRAAKARTRHG